MLSSEDKAKGTAALKSLSKLLKDKKTRLKICWENDKNCVFRYLYGITNEYVRRILGELTIENLEEITLNRNTNFPKEDLYVFSKDVTLTDATPKEVNETLYIKLSINEKGKTIIVISFHDAKHSF